MANTAITPTRMVLNQLKGRLKTARRGHKLLKDKRDELMRQFLDNVRLNKQLRAKVEQGLTEAFGSLSVASAIMSPEMLEQSLLYPRQSVELGMTYQNIMSVNVPVYDFQTRNSDPSEIFPYGFAQTSGEMRSRSWRRCLRICWSLRRSKRPRRCSRRRSKRPAAASTRSNT